VLSVIVPAYNEARRLPETLDCLRAYLDGADEEYEVLVVDDGSTDGTPGLVEAATARWPQLRLIGFRANAGKGAAVRAGMLQARGGLRLFTDADMSTPIDELPRLREAIQGTTAVAIGSRAVPGAVVEIHQPWRREVMGRTYNRLLQLLALPGLHDTQCGFKLFTAEAAVACFEPLQTLRFGFDAEVLLRARRRGWGIAEIGVHWRHADESRVSPLRDSASTFTDLVRLRLRRPD
jgi:dolichyl-phosphate beta-glucosyltransferase